MKKQSPSCSVCGKTDSVGYNRPHSLHKTKKIIKPNLQKKAGKIICTGCIRNSKITS